MVAGATTESSTIHRDRQPVEKATYEPGALEYGNTYYWRIDEVNDLHPDSPWVGRVWSFVTVDFVVVLIVDDFESYTDDLCGGCCTPWQIWIDGVENGTGSQVGYLVSRNGTFGETVIVHDGWQSMPFFHNNDGTGWDTNDVPFYSECVRTWSVPQDWTVEEADSLTLYFRGAAGNDRDSFYVAIEYRHGRIATVTAPDPEAVLATEWRKRHISLPDVQAAGADVTAVKKMYIGVGDRDNPQPGGTGVVYIDDIMVTNRMPSGGGVEATSVM